MKQRSQSNKSLLVLALLSLSLAEIPAATATYIKGYVSNDPEPGVSIQKATSLPVMPVKPVVLKPITVKPVTARIPVTTPPAPEPVLVSEPASVLEGAWRCVTVVTDSSCAQVRSGQTAESEINFARTPGGGIAARWQQPGWSESDVLVRSLGNGDVSISRVNQYHGPGSLSGWSARSFDRYRRIDNDQLVASSRVDQFIAGRYSGSYMTQSTLQRLNSSR